jgi:hypothetical protein
LASFFTAVLASAAEAGINCKSVDRLTINAML